MPTKTDSIVEHILTEIQGLDPDERTLLYEILENRRIEESRGAISLRCDETMREYERGILKTGTPDDLFADLKMMYKITCGTGFERYNKADSKNEFWGLFLKLYT